MTYDVGEGVLKKMLELKDIPSTDEIHFSITVGESSNLYFYRHSTNAVTVIPGPKPEPGHPEPSPDPPFKFVISPNIWAGGLSAPLAIVIHTAAGSLAGMDSWFANPASQVSAHFAVGLTGHVHQYVDLANAAWANGIVEAGSKWPAIGGTTNPNRQCIAIETEDLKNPAQPVTDTQYQSVLWACRQALLPYPGIKYLLGHKDISPASRPNCPGNRWIASGCFAQLAAELGLQTV